MGISEVFSDSLFQQFSFYVMVVILKMFVVQMYTPVCRIVKKVYINEEDVKFLVGEKKGVGLVSNDPDVERIRRCHLNDLENVVPFVLIGLFYVLSGPSPVLAVMLFRIFALSRICHSVAYLLPLPQPSRTLSFAVGFFVNCFMAVKVLAGTAF